MVLPTVARPSHLNDIIKIMPLKHAQKPFSHVKVAFVRWQRSPPWQLKPMLSPDFWSLTAAIQGGPRLSVVPSKTTQTLKFLPKTHRFLIRCSVSRNTTWTQAEDHGFLCRSYLAVQCCLFMVSNFNLSYFFDRTAADSVSIQGHSEECLNLIFSYVLIL